MNLLIDADDTLWENNIYFERAFDAFCDFLDHSSLTPPQVRDQRGPAWPLIRGAKMQVTNVRYDCFTVPWCRPLSHEVNALAERCQEPWL